MPNSEEPSDVSVVIAFVVIVGLIAFCIGYFAGQSAVLTSIENENDLSGCGVCCDGTMLGHSPDEPRYTKNVTCETMRNGDLVCQGYCGVTF